MGGLLFRKLLFSFVFFFFLPVCLSRGCKNGVKRSHLVFSFLVIHFFHRGNFCHLICEMCDSIVVFSILNWCMHKSYSQLFTFFCVYLLWTGGEIEDKRGKSERRE